MHVTAKLTRKTAHHTNPGTDHLIVDITGDPDATLRPKLGLVAVIDRSGSMSVGNKLGIVKASLDHVVGYLTDDDRLAVVGFDNEVDTLLEPTTGHDEGQQAARAAVRKLTPRGATALHGATARGIQLAGRMADDLGDGSVVRVVVLTDGRANNGPTSREAFTSLVGDLPAGVSVSTIGVGVDCDHDLLGSIAEQGAGSYGFVEAPADAARVIGAEIGGLLSAVATDVTVTVQARQRATLADALGIPASRQDANTTSRVSVRLGTLLAGESRQLVVPVTLDGPGRSHARPVTIADVTVNGTVDDADTSVQVLPKVKFVAEPDPADDNLVAHVDRARLAQAQIDAERQAAAGKFDIASDLLTSVTLTDPASIAMRDAIVGQYADPASFSMSASFRRSASSLLSAGSSRLIGASEQFDVLASRTYGAYTTDEQRDIATTVTNTVSSTLSGDPSEPDDGPRTD